MSAPKDERVSALTHWTRPQADLDQWVWLLDPRTHRSNLQCSKMRLHWNTKREGEEGPMTIIGPAFMSLYASLHCWIRSG